MVRAPCCEKMGLKKGPWSPDEDKVLISYIEKYGHGNWRALPKLAGLLRCGKSCRLRWINYLKPDIKRGNFTKEEEETIINLHQMLGNRWSAIAARLPGRTDNEIKNVWHTHLKKRLKTNESCEDSKTHSVITILKRDNNDNIETTSEMSSVTDSSIEKVEVKREEVDYSSQYIPTIDESFWSEDLPKEMNEDINDAKSLTLMESVDSKVEVDDSSMDFWYDLFIRAGDIPDLPEF